MKLIVAVDEQWGIGKKGDLLMSIPDDMKFFRETTRNAVLVMGYNTLLSFPSSKPLPGRLNIVLSDIDGCRVKGAIVCRTMDQLHTLLEQFRSDDLYVIGGGMMYRQLLPYCDEALITKMRFTGEADTFIPNLDELHNWSVIHESEVREYEGISYSFVTYHNAAPAALSFCDSAPDFSSYFKKKATLPEPDGREDEAYRKAFQALLNAYVAPLAEGMDAREVDRFLKTKEPLERYLRERGLIANEADFEQLKR